jgi:Fe2+ transport system protein B
VEKKGNILGIKLLSELLGMPIVPTVSSMWYGIKELLRKVIDNLRLKQKNRTLL